MAKTYRPYVPEQDLLLPPSLRDWLPEDKSHELWGGWTRNSGSFAKK